MDLIEELRGATIDYRRPRPAVPSVFAEREAFLAAGDYPYNDAVKAYILAKHDVPEDLHRQLEHEIYLASGQHKVNEMIAEEQAALGLRWQPITELEPAERLQVEWRGRTDGPFRVKPDGRGDWLLVPRGRRTHGFRVADLVAKHKAFLLAKEEGQTRMNAPGVVMFRSVTTSAQ